MRKGRHFIVIDRWITLSLTCLAIKGVRTCAESNEQEKRLVLPSLMINVEESRSFLPRTVISRFGENVGREKNLYRARGEGGGAEREDEISALLKGRAALCIDRLYLTMKSHGSPSLLLTTT